MAVEMVRPAPQEGQPPAQKTVTLPPSRAALAWDKATDQLVAAAEAEEAKLNERYEAARIAYQEARQQAHLMRQLRGLARVDGTAEALATDGMRRSGSTLGGRWSRKHDACVNCGRTDRKHASKGRCVTCQRHYSAYGHEWPHKEAPNDGN